MMKNLAKILAVLAMLAIQTELSRADEFAFEAKTLDPNVGKVCYALTLADVDGDGRQDVVAVTENRVLWYQNKPSPTAPEWKPRVIIEDQTERDNVCIAPFDIDADGKIDFALGAGWAGKNTGQLCWLSRGASLDEKWHVHAIGHEPWTHRMRWANVTGEARPQLVVSPLNKTQGDGVRLLAFTIPKNPKTDKWPSQVLNASMNRMHNHWHVDGGKRGVATTLTASQEGVHLIEAATGGGSATWKTTKLGSGASGEKPEQRGAGEIRIGKLKSGQRFIVTVEPMHGQACVVYLEPKAGEKTADGFWSRQVIDGTLNRGHALWAADLNGDGTDEIVLGHSDLGTGDIKGPGVFIYQATDGSGTKWTKHIVDNGGVATEDLVCADLNGDGKIDIVAGGRATHNVKLYVNQGK